MSVDRSKIPRVNTKSSSSHMKQRIINLLREVDSKTRRNTGAGLDTCTKDREIEIEFSPGFQVLGQCKEYFKPGISHRDFHSLENVLLESNSMYTSDLIYDYYVYGSRDRCNIGSAPSKDSSISDPSRGKNETRPSPLPKCTRIREKVRDTIFGKPDGKGLKQMASTTCKYSTEIQEKSVLGFFTAIVSGVSSETESQPNDITWGVPIPSTDGVGLHHRNISRDSSSESRRRRGVLFPLKSSSQQNVYPIKLNAKLETRLSKRGIKGGASIPKFLTVRVSLRRSFTTTFHLNHFDTTQSNTKVIGPVERLLSGCLTSKPRAVKSSKVTPSETCNQFACTMSIIRLWEGSTLSDAEDRMRNSCQPEYSVEIEYNYVPFSGRSVQDTPQTSSTRTPGVQMAYHKLWANVIAEDMQLFANFVREPHYWFAKA